MTVLCSICQEDINFCDEEISVLKCGHLFHRGCLQQWLSTSSTCPECRISVAVNNYVQKLYPSKNEDADLVYRGSSDDTKSILKVYEDSTKNVQQLFTQRIVSLEKESLALTKELKKSSDDLQKCSDEKNVVEEENLRLKTELGKLKKKLSSVMKLIKDEDSSGSIEENISNEAVVPSTS